MTAADHPQPPLLHLQGISKLFGAELALDNVSFDIRQGEVLALVGQNGSGKSTLIKILTGYHAPERGADIQLNGHEATISYGGVHLTEPTVSTATQMPIRAVHQDSALVPGLNAVDNIALMAGYAHTKGRRIDWKRQIELTRSALELVNAADIDIFTPVDELEVIRRAQIAIARALVGWEDHHGLLLLDEPTSAMSDTEANRLFEVLADLQQKSMTILYVSHRLEEVLQIANRVTIIRDGRLVATEDAADLHYDLLVQLMVGPALSTADSRAETPARLQPVATAEPALVLRGVSSGPVHDLSLELRQGEILGITGLAGAGHEELARLLGGQAKARAGTFQVRDGEPHPLANASPKAARASGIALVPADRQVSGLVAGFSVADNITLPRLSRFMRRGWLSRMLELADARKWVGSMRISPGDPEKSVDQLSGGNQQKVVIGKFLGIADSVLVLADPTAGVDVGARASIYERFLAEANEGLPILVCSSDADDLLHLCDRVIVLYKGHVVSELEEGQITKEAILHASGRTAS
jgi:ribose transport system ATP-binding protein